MQHSIFPAKTQKTAGFQFTLYSMTRVYFQSFDCRVCKYTNVLYVVYLYNMTTTSVRETLKINKEWKKAPKTKTWLSYYFVYIKHLTYITHTYTYIYYILYIPTATRIVFRFHKTRVCAQLKKKKDIGIYRTGRKFVIILLQYTICAFLTAWSMKNENMNYDNICTANADVYCTSIYIYVCILL